MTNDDAAQIARVVLLLRAKRADHLPSEILGEYSWGLLLTMFIADAEGARVTAVDVFDQSSTPRPLGRRWMQALMSVGLVNSEGPCDGKNIVSLTPEGIHAVEACMQDAQDWMNIKSPRVRVR